MSTTAAVSGDQRAQLVHKVCIKLSRGLGSNRPKADGKILRIVVFLLAAVSTM